MLASALLLTHLLMLFFCSENDKEKVDGKMLHDALNAVSARNQRIKVSFNGAETFFLGFDFFYYAFLNISCFF